MVFHFKRTQQEESATKPGRARLVWYHSLFWKITCFLVSGVVLAYIIGAAVGWVMVGQSSMEQWNRRAELNAQVTSSAIRTIYTFVAIDTDNTGQITKIISERPLGDDASILDTGFNPIDVLGLAAAQTKNNVWLFKQAEKPGTFVSVADAFGEAGQANLALPGDASLDDFFVGFAAVGDVRHFIAYVPVVTPAGKLDGAVVTSIGEVDALLESQTHLARRSFFLLVTILIVTGAGVIFVMRKVFQPVPALIDALTRIAEDDTRSVTPFQDRPDEIGRFAVAIETLREAVVERENLREVRDVAKQMEHLAHHDALTGLPNRAFFNKRLERAISSLEENGERFNLMLLDLDRFKAINDGLGHASGDALLIALTERLSLLMGTNDLAARLGGDEFAILQCVRKDAVAEASRLAKSLIRAVSRPFTLLGRDVSVGTSIGIATAPLHGHNAADLMRNADIALYGAKSAGRGTYRLFKDGMEMAGTGNTIETDMELALERGEFQLHYQPIFSFKRDLPVGFEALIRWQHPSLGWVSPADFIPIAEKTGQIVAIGEWVLKQACADAAHFPDDTTIAVNLSPAQFQQTGLVTKIKTALANNNLTPSRLELELTETALLSGEEASHVLSDIHALGVSIALDDFGIGYSSLSYLLTLPVDKIKIDRSFVTDVVTRDQSRAIVVGILRLASSLGLKTTAEGIETADQLTLIGDLGCDFVQGYHLGRPVSFQQIQHMYQNIFPEKNHSIGG
jgi:diguanylate cyclase (GGDEF)-like protein